MELLMMPMYKHSSQHDAQMKPLRIETNKVISAYVHNFQLAMALKTLEFDDFFLEQGEKMGSSLFWKE